MIQHLLVLFYTKQWRAIPNARWLTVLEGAWTGLRQDKIIQAGRVLYEDHTLVRLCYDGLYKVFAAFLKKLEDVPHPDNK